MILKYYGINVSFDQLARTKDYRNTAVMMNQLQKKYNCSVLMVASGSAKALKEMIKHAIDNGILLKWDVDMLKSPDALAKKKSKKNKTSAHARIINGYILDSDEVVKIIYSDSWGKADLNKEMGIDAAMNMTNLLATVYPNNISPELIEELKTKKNAVGSKKIDLPMPDKNSKGKYLSDKRKKSRKRK